MIHSVITQIHIGCNHSVPSQRELNLEFFGKLGIVSQINDLWGVSNQTRLEKDMSLIFSVTGDEPCAKAIITNLSHGTNNSPRIFCGFSKLNPYDPLLKCHSMRTEGLLIFMEVRPFNHLEKLAFEYLAARDSKSKTTPMDFSYN